MAGKVITTLQVLMQLRDEQARTNERVERLERVLVDVRDLLRDRLDLRDEVRDHERRISARERRPT